MAQDNTAAKSGQADTVASKSEITVQGCLDRSRGDYILEQVDPGMTYELEGSHGIKLRQYFGRRSSLPGLDTGDHPGDLDQDLGEAMQRATGHEIGNAPMKLPGKKRPSR